MQHENHQHPSPSPLHAALAGHLGQELTPDVAWRILDAAIRSFAGDVGRGPGARAQELMPELHLGHTIQCERFASVLDELMPLHSEHWHETEGHRNKAVPMKPNYAAYLLREAEGKQVQITCRNAQGTLVGGLLLRLCVSEHSGSWLAIEDALFVTRRSRGGWLAAHMIRYAKRLLLHIGVTEFRASTKHMNSASSLFIREGFVPVATELVLMIEKEQGHVL